MTTLSKRLDMHFATCAAAAAGVAVLGGADKAEAAVVYSGVVNITIPGDIDGVYLDLITGLTTTSSGTNPGFDINPYFGGNNMFLAGPTYVIGTGSTASNLALGAPIDSGSSYIGTGFPSMSGFTAGVPGILGFKFMRESDSATLYGWARIIKGASSSSAGTILDYAYEDTGAGLPAGVVPGPASLAALAMGVACRGRRRRANA